MSFDTLKKSFKVACVQDKDVYEIDLKNEKFVARGRKAKRRKYGISVRDERRLFFGDYSFPLKRVKSVRRRRRTSSFTCHFARCRPPPIRKGRPTQIIIFLPSPNHILNWIGVESQKRNFFFVFRILWNHIANSRTSPRLITQ